MLTPRIEIGVLRDLERKMELDARGRNQCPGTQYRIVSERRVASGHQQFRQPSSCASPRTAAEGHECVQGIAVKDGTIRAYFEQSGRLELGKIQHLVANRHTAPELPRTSTKDTVREVPQRKMAIGEVGGFHPTSHGTDLPRISR